jgi:hypothetical protein
MCRRKLIVSLGHSVVTTESEDFLTTDSLFDSKLYPVTKVMNGGRLLGVEHVVGHSLHLTVISALLGYQYSQSSSQASSAFVLTVSSTTSLCTVALK